MEIILSIVGLLCIVVLIVAGIWSKAADVGQQEHDKQVLKDVEEAKKTHNRLRTDDKYRKRVRDIFSR